MSGVTITTRQSQLTELTHAQVDQNFLNLKSAVDTNTNAIGNYAQPTGAASIGVTPTGGIASTNVQSALAELDSEKAPLIAPSFVSGIKNTGGGIVTVLSTDLNGAYLEAQGANNLRFHTNGAERVRVDYSGNFMVGRTTAINVSRDVGHFQRDQNGPTYLIVNNQSTGASASANLDFEAYGGSWQIQVPSSTTYQNPLIFTSTHTPAGEKMRITYDGNLSVGATSASFHTLTKSTTEGLGVLGVGTPTVYSAAFYAVAGVGVNSAGTAMSVFKHSTTNRSINAAGTFNASGADYAEYMTKSQGCGTLAKGQVVGVDASGLLTDKWSESLSFLIKSTDPSYVGGDVWGNEASLGVTRPVEPVFEAPADDDTARQQFDTVTMPAYRATLADFEAKLEAARQRVDRIAYCGQVPVNVTGATPGQYVVPMQAGDGIGAVLIDSTAITFDDYRRAVGIVQNILPDGRANVRVKVV